MSDEPIETGERVIDLDADLANANWLRIVGAAHQYESGNLTADEYRERVAYLSGQPPENIRLPDDHSPETEAPTPEQ
jgi:hypothetical protein